MPQNISEIINIIEKAAPLELSESWDNSGWQIICDMKKPVDKIMLALSLTPDIIDKAIISNISLIISHHPLFFNNVKQVDVSNYLGSILYKSLKSDISIYSAHTNFDKVEKGINDILAQKLQLIDVTPIIPEKHNPNIGMGRMGCLSEPLNLYNWLDMIKTILKCDDFKVVNQSNKTTVKKIALCGGAGTSLISYLPDDVDVFITGDLKYHEALETTKFVLIDANHYNTEQFFIDGLIEILKPLNLEITGVYSSNPWIIY